MTHGIRKVATSAMSANLFSSAVSISCCFGGGGGGGSEEGAGPGDKHRRIACADYYFFVLRTHIIALTSLMNVKVIFSPVV